MSPVVSIRINILLFACLPGSVSSFSHSRSIFLQPQYVLVLCHVHVHTSLHVPLFFTFHAIFISLFAPPIVTCNLHMSLCSAHSDTLHILLAPAPPCVYTISGA